MNPLFDNATHGGPLTAPATTSGLALTLEMPEDLTDLLIVTAATPIGLLLAVYCDDYDHEQERVISAVLLSIVLFPFTVTGWVF